MITYLGRQLHSRFDHTLKERKPGALAALAGADRDVGEHRGVADGAVDGVASDILVPLRGESVRRANSKISGLHSLEQLLVTELVCHGDGEW